jgi:hypothetical protein
MKAIYMLPQSLTKCLPILIWAQAMQRRQVSATELPWLILKKHLFSLYDG